MRICRSFGTSGDERGKYEIAKKGLPTLRFYLWKGGYPLLSRQDGTGRGGVVEGEVEHRMC